MSDKCELCAHYCEECDIWPDCDFEPIFITGITEIDFGKPTLN